jgi:hypothetical protein
MPRAGNNSANRAKAHLQWADRYNRYGDTQKAAAHFGRALEYDRRSASGRGDGQEFGGPGLDDTPPYSEMKKKYRQWVLDLVGGENIDTFYDDVGIPPQPDDEARYDKWIKLGAKIVWTLPR